MNLIDRIFHAFGKRQRDRQLDFAGLVRATVNGEKIDPDTAAGVLEAAGRTPTQLQTAAERILRRRELRRSIEERSLVLSERLTELGEMAEVDAEFARQIAELQTERERVIGEMRDRLYGDGAMRYEADQRASLQRDERELREIEKQADVKELAGID